MGHRHFIGFLAGVAATMASAGAVLAAAEIEDIRIGQHRSYLRVVFDVSEPVSYRVEAGRSLIIDRVQTGSAVLNADASQAPLKRLLVVPEEGSARVDFESTGPIAVKAFALTPDSFGGHRLVVDLIPQGQSAPRPTLQEGEKPQGTSHETVTSLPATPAGGPVPAPSESHEATTTAKPGAVPAVGPAPASSKTAGPPAPEPAPQGQTAAAHPAPAEGAKDAISAPAGHPDPTQSAQAGRNTLAAEAALADGRYGEACRLSGEALGLQPGDARAHAVQGACLLKQNDPDGAKRAFVLALQIDPHFHRARIGLAEAEAAQGNREEARKHLEKVLGDSPPPDDVARIVDMMEDFKPPAVPVGPS